jgi:hypothetical protein
MNEALSAGWISAKGHNGYAGLTCGGRRFAFPLYVLPRRRMPGAQRLCRIGIRKDLMNESGFRLTPE